MKTGRVMLGATNPLDSAPGTIRGDFAIDVGRNICHGSDAVESADREIALWFPEGLNESSKSPNCKPGCCTGVGRRTIDLAEAVVSGAESCSTIAAAWEAAEHSTRLQGQDGAPLGRR